MKYVADKPLSQVLIAIVAFTFCYAAVLWDLANLWATNSVYSYGFAVPLISSYIVWSRWGEIKIVRLSPDYAWGAALVLGGLSMLSVGHLGALMSLEASSIIPTLAGLILLLGGRQVLRAVSFPLMYLLLMVPVWSYLFSSVQAPSQEFSAIMAARMLRISGIPALQQGTTILLPSASLEVLRECSGINQLIALIVMALPAAYLWIGARASQILVVGLAVIVGYISNGARIALLGWLIAKGIDVSNPHNAMHLIPGFVTASVAYVIIWACISFFARFNQPQASDMIASMPGDAPEALPKRHRLIDAATLACMLFVGGFQVLAMPAGVRATLDLASIPHSIAGWTVDWTEQSRSREFAGFDADLLGTYPGSSGLGPFAGIDDQLVRTYHNRSGACVQLFVGYYSSQQSGKELTTEVSLGLQRLASNVSLSLDPEALTLNEVVHQGNERRKGVVFWYDLNGRIVANIYKAKGYTLWDTITRQRSNGAIVMIAWDSRDGGSREDALAFAQALLPVLQQHLPS